MDSFPYHKSVEELTFTDDFMFGTIMKNKPICKGVLERLLHIKVGKIEYQSLRSMKAKASVLTFMLPNLPVSSTSKFKRPFRPTFQSAHGTIKASWT